MERKLAAILAADVVGYGRLMEKDEAGTLAALKARRRDILQPILAQHQGRIVKLMGDGVLVEFASAVNAVACAVALQEAMAAANADLPEDRKIVLRVGVNLGDLIVEGTDLYGDGVNIAARLESLAEPGGIYVSQTVFSHIRSKIDLRFDDLGECNLKNMAEPLRVYRVAGRSAGSMAMTGNAVLASKPSIAVLPFTNMSGDPDQQYFSDGITEDIITELSRFQELLVIARNSSFQYRDKALDVKRIGQDLGVAYLVEGSVRRAGTRIRITAQLVELATGTHLWAERYDRDLEDIFAVQDEVTHTIVATLAGRLAANSADKSRRKPTQDLVAYDYFLQGRECLTTRYDAAAAEPLLRRAIELDPVFAQAYAMQAGMYVFTFFEHGQTELLREALVYAQRALSLDENNAWCQWAMGLVCTFFGRLDLAGLHLHRAVALNPNDVKIAYVHAHWLARMGHTTEALHRLDIAVRRDPFPPDWYWEARTTPLLQEKRYEEAIQAVNQMNRLHTWSHAYLAIAYAHLGQLEEARAEAAEVMRLKPDYSPAWISSQEPYKDPAYLEHLLEGLRKAGLPE